jgi:A/G-specific adenine glycosylase
MLQQTRVETVIPYYERWLKRFPDIGALAEAEEDEVLRAWQGLGYYSRARRLHQGAKVVRERYAGVLPQNSEDLRKLPGVGQYTAGAVASIAFGEAVPAVDGNVKRVFSRLFDLTDPTPAEFQRLGEELVDPKRPGDFNQALMELGATVCTPRIPVCGECPLDLVCLALDRGTIQERPVSKTKKRLPEMDVAVVVAVVRDDAGIRRLLLRKRPDSGLLAGMWEFPGVEVDTSELGRASDACHSCVRAQTAALAEDLGLGPLPMKAESNLASEPVGLDLVAHVFSHLRARYWPVLFQVEWAGVGGMEAPGCEWVATSKLDEVPLSVAQGKIARAALEVSGV